MFVAKDSKLQKKFYQKTWCAKKDLLEKKSGISLVQAPGNFDSYIRKNIYLFLISVSVTTQNMECIVEFLVYFNSDHNNSGDLEKEKDQR